MLAPNVFIVDYAQVARKSLGGLTKLALVAVLLACTTGCMTGIREYFRNGCEVGPDYCKPAVPVESEWIDSRDERLSTEPPDLSSWWTVFDDPCLNECIRIAYSENITLREAGFRIMEARALRRVAAGNLFPQSQEATGSYTRTQLSSESGFGGIGLGGGQIDIWQVGGQLAWELDFWGRFRRAVEAADANLDATVEAYDDVLVILLGDVAATYVEIRTLQQRIDYAERNAESLKGSLRIATDQFEVGRAGKLDVAQAQTNYSQTVALVPQFQAQLRQAQNRLCVLLGRPPEDLTTLLSMSPARIPQAEPDVIVGIPAELIRRRPDIRQAERLVARQSAYIGVAEADLYPAFSITGNLGYQAPTFARLFRSSAFTGSVSPGFNWNILNYGRIRNGVIAEQALFQQYVAQYQNRVLEAQREAEDAIVAFLRSQEEAEAYRTSASAAVEASSLVQQQFEGGITDFNRVFVAESTLVTQQDALAVAEGKVASSLVDVYRALGGGWEIRLTQPVGFQGVPVALPQPQPEPVQQPEPVDESPEAIPALPSEAREESLLDLPAFAIE
ncbi:efflux transporter outer membrane subunit [Aeoliella sp. ICT_H6.2]|uniref:Efflux transporter outer membrane subunit n=1 Tax=Aeoliella straminimaris TaxID=2954799 RepID=A0A9X2JID0_9BACT|nr:efflux transporter outer membrane subunit [Aeoliella straminimaris]MCO6045598.1 efflux transporter outer membrane subunit [Aeoliella straminimaris]